MNRIHATVVLGLVALAVLATYPAAPRGALAQIRQTQWPPVKQSTLAAIDEASAAYALDAACMRALADQESTLGRNPAAYADPNAPVAGLYQFWSQINPRGTWQWAEGHYGRQLAPSARLDDTASAWTAAYLMDLRGGRDWRWRDCRLPGLRRYGAAARPSWHVLRSLPGASK